MIFRNKRIGFVFAFIVGASFLLSTVPQKAQDLTTGDDLSLGASVFVFRKSRTNPQTKSTSRRYFLRNSPSQAANSRRRSRRNLTAGYKRKSNNVAAKTPTGKRRSTVPARNKLSETLTAKAETLLESGQIDQAVETYKAALKSSAQNKNAKQGLSAALIAKGDEIAQANGGEAAKIYYEEAVKTDISNYIAYAKLAEAFEDMQFSDDALTNYEKALKLNSAAKELFIPIARLYYQKEDYTTAEKYLIKAEVAAESAETVFLRGLLHYKRNENERALAAFTKTISLDADYSEAYLYQAEIYERLNKETEAIAAYRKTVEIEPESTEAWFDLGVANYNSGNYAEAETAYRRVIELDADHPDAHANLASVYRQQQRYAEANGEYKLAAVRIKDDADLYSEWGFCLGKTEEWDKAIARLQTARELSPDAIDYTNLGWGFYNAAQKDIKADDEAAAEAKLAQGKAALQKAVELNPQFDAAQLNLGVTYTRLGEYQQAIEALTKANNLHKDWVIGINELGVANRRSNNLQAAVDNFQKAINLDDKFALGYFNLGEAQIKLGRKKEAKKTLSKLKQLNPTLARKLDDVIEGRIKDEAERQIRKRIPRLPF